MFCVFSLHVLPCIFPGSCNYRWLQVTKLKEAQSAFNLGSLNAVSCRLHVETTSSNVPICIATLAVARHDGDYLLKLDLCSDVRLENI